MIYYPLTTNTINNEDKKLAIEVIKSGNITRGYYNKSVEKYFSKKFNRYALLVNSGSSANLLAMSLLTNNKGRYNLNKNDEVIIPTLCWSTSLYPIIQTGLKPVFVDIEFDTLNFDTNLIESKITDKTKAIFVSPVLKDVFSICKFENQSFDILFSSGLQNVSDDKDIGGGGLYRIRGTFDNFKLTKIISGSTHGILKMNKEIFVVNEKNGICKLDKELNIIKKYPLPQGYRAHGIDYSKKLNCWILACAHFDGIIILDSSFKLKEKILFSNQKSFYDNIAQHHCNDVCVLNKYAYVSMFSLTAM